MIAKGRLLSSVCVVAVLVATTPTFGKETTSYTYDALGRLVQSSVSGGPSNARQTKTCFDSAGNRSQYMTANGGVPTCGTPTPAPSPTPTPTSAPNRPPVCTTLTVGPIPGYATSTINVTASMVLGKCSDPDGDPLSITSPAVPYTIYVAGDRQPITRTHAISDGRGGSATMTIYVSRS